MDTQLSSIFAEQFADMVEHELVTIIPELEDDTFLAQFDDEDEAPVIENTQLDLERAVDHMIDSEDISLEASEGEPLELESEFMVEELDEDVMWQVRTGLDLETLSGAIETIIFMSDKPVSLAKMRTIICEDIPLRILHEVISKLQAEYEFKHHGLRLLEVAEGYQFRTKATYSKYVQDLFKVKSLVLTPSALEVLAIIAYKQPVSKVEIEKIRGVDSSHIVRQLMDKRLVKVEGRSNELGRPVVYATTPEFLEVFNLADVSQLPPEHELEEMSESDVGKISDIKTICQGDKTKFVFDEFEELESLSSNIKKISADTKFTKTLKIEEKRRTSEEGAIVRSAFDLLEEFVNNKSVADENKLAVASDTMLPAMEPRIISDLSAGPYNAPEIEEEDDFEMIDLDTGEAVIAESCEQSVDVIEASAHENHEEDIVIDESNFVSFGGSAADVAPVTEDLKAAPVEDNFLFSTDSGNVREADSLEAALDAAFSNLTGDSFKDLSTPLATEEELDRNQDNVDQKVGDLTSLTDSMMDMANDLDLDLSFMKDDEAPVNTLQ
ncbi:MAG: SMC-Scp complex subunit ScpB [Bacteriovoracaceae bacterium]|nr:SMC-Scp complex subunit ScpB [Bacteriovoracaceae bacterium]